MDSNHSIRVVKLLARILQTNAQLNQTSVSFGFKNENQNEDQNQTNCKINILKVTYK